MPQPLNWKEFEKKFKDNATEGGGFHSKFDEFVPEQGRDTLVGPGGIQHVDISDADKDSLWHNCFQVDGKNRGIRHLLWRTLGQAKGSRLTRDEMKTWLERILAWCTSSGV